VSGRRPFQEALERLSVYFKPRDAGERIESALHEDPRFGLYRNGISVPRHIKIGLRVMIEHAADGSWRWSIVEQGQGMRAPLVDLREDDEGRQIATIEVPPAPVWEVYGDGIEWLLPSRRSQERQQRRIARAIIQRLHPDNANDVPTETLKQEIADHWADECHRQLIDPTSEGPPSWQTVDRMMGRSK
jgi:hypothetical protein